MRAQPALNATYRIVLGVLGGLVLVTGLVLVPYPGPGWLIVFAGLAILATEFAWAQRVHGFATHQYQRWTRWLGRQHWGVRIMVMAVTCAIVLVTLWLLGVFNMVGGWFGLRWDWLRSPLFGG